jgi:hypothetical protein
MKESFWGNLYGHTPRQQFFERQPDRFSGWSGARGGKGKRRDYRNGY